ncbi:hypothetical protein HK102_007385 [Quaeritorhiza haematococci]|nr:hypothetical protein HK102_007385 [Quaeritorhiza haematococci]
MEITKNLVGPGSLSEALADLFLLFSAVVFQVVVALPVVIIAVAWQLLVFPYNLVMRRKKEAPKTVVITGASSGIGEALAKEYAVSQPGMVLGLTGRNADRLNNVAAECRSRGAQVETFIVDMTRDIDALRSWLMKFDSEHSVDLIIANAGTIGMDPSIATMEEEERFDPIVRVNVLGTLHTIAPIVKKMKERKRGHIAINASINGLFGPPNAVFYNCTKAALLSAAKDLRSLLAPHNILVSVFLPGFTESRMTVGMKSLDKSATAPSILMVSSRTLARNVKKNLDKGVRTIGSPFVEYVPAFVLQGVPPVAKDIFTWMAAVVHPLGTQVS